MASATGPSLRGWTGTGSRVRLRDVLNRTVAMVGRAVRDDPWTPDLVARVAAAIHEALLPEDWAEHVDQREALSLSA
ncbi:MAG: hypothetical protein JWQ81_1538 [Amycolatopsis sp.]|nr:hypothetical protein [Amycolatopsis sp.]